MPRYHCTSCGHEFEDSGQKLRCPECLRQNGIEEQAAEPTRRGRKREGDNPKRLLLIVSVLTIGALVAAGALWTFKRKVELPKPGELALLDGPTLQKTLQKRGVAMGDAIEPFAFGPELRRLIRTLPGGDATAKARAIAKALASTLAPLRIDVNGRGRESVRTAEELAADLNNKGVKVSSLTSLEAALLLAAPLRKADLAAVVAEVHEVDAPMKAADGTGMLGRFAVAIYAADKLGKKPLLVLDPARAAKLPKWAGGGGDATMTSKAQSIVALDDATVVAHLYAQRALREVVRDPKAPRRAYELAELALKAGFRSATLHVTRAVVLAQAGQSAGIGDALDEARKAIALRSDAPRHTALGQLLIMQRDSTQAQKELEKAVALDATYWPAYQTLATLRWLLGDREGGRKFLDKAIKIAPDEPSVMTLQATQYLADDEDAKAVALLRKAAARDSSDQIRLQLYMALIKSNLGAEARKVRKQLLAEARQKDLVKAQLEKLEQATGFDPNDSSGDTTADKTAASQPGAGTGGVKLDAPPTLPGADLKLPDVKLTPPSGLDQPFTLPDVKLTP